MPIFDFVCQKCGKEFEKLVRNEKDVLKCPSCESKKVKKKEVQSINFELKGIGVYKNGTH